MSEFRYAIMGAGNIAHKFADAVRTIDDCCVCAVASASLERAQAFAEKEGIKAFYGDYEEMLVKEKPDCVYIAAVNSKHYELAVLCAKHHVHVLCEKAMFMNYDDAVSFEKIAAENGIFWMEAMWSRFLPANVRAKQAIKEGFIGDVCFADVEIGFRVEQNPENRYFGSKLGGGAARDITVYAYEIATWLLDSEEESSDIITTFAETGIDAQETIMMKLKNGIPVTIKSSFIATLDDNLTVQGTEGCIVIPHPHWAGGFTVHKVNGGEATGSFTDDSGVNGFVYEAKEVMDCIRKGLKESDVVPHKDTLAFAKLTSRILEKR